MYSKYDFLSVQGHLKIQLQRQFGHFCVIPWRDFSLQNIFLNALIYVDKM